MAKKPKDFIAEEQLMKKVSFAVFFCLSLFLSVPSLAAFPSIKTYPTLVNSLENANLVRGIVNFQKCSLNSNLTTDDMKEFYNRLQTFGFDFNLFTRHFSLNREDANDSIEVSKTFFAIIEFPDLGKTNHQIRLRFFSLKQAEILYTLLNPIDYTTKFSLSFHCEFGDNDTDGIVLYQIVGSISNSTSASVVDNITQSP